MTARRPSGMVYAMVNALERRISGVVAASLVMAAFAAPAAQPPAGSEKTVTRGAARKAHRPRNEQHKALKPLDSQRHCHRARIETSLSGQTPRTLHVQPRYHRWFVEPGVDWLETNTHHATVDWDIPLDQCALVFVDVWQHHYLKDTEARSDRIVTEKIVPLLYACRREGVTVIHAPAPRLAKDHPNRFPFEGDKPPSPIDPEWPPPAFRAKKDDYARYARPVEARQQERNHLSATNTIHALAEPIPGEPVIADGEELHQYCKENGILFLFFLGFNTNACILMRDYGTLAMSRRGYEVIILRDCTTGMESAESAPGLAQTRNAILLLEMFGKYSLTSDEFIAGLSGIPAPDK